MRFLIFFATCFSLVAGEKVMFDQVLQNCETELGAAKKLLAEILSPKTDTLKLYNQLQVHIDAMVSLPSLLIEVHPDPKVREEAEKCEQEVSQFTTSLSLNKPLYEVFSALQTENLAPDAQRLVKQTLRDFRRSGIDKDDATRTKIKALEEELVLIGQNFSRNIRDDQRFIEVDAKTGLTGLPADFIASHPILPNGKVKITTDYPDYIPYISYAEDANARKDLWMVFNQRGYPANQKVLKDLILKRYELAKLLGYASYADYVVEDKMIKKSKTAADFIDKIAKIAQKGAQKEYKILLAEKRKTDPKAKIVYPYEKAYLEEKIKQERYQVDSQAVRAYFSFPKVRDGLLKLTGRLYGLEFKRIKDLKTWHASVEVYDVLHNKRIIGRIYLDLHPRDSKFKHAAQFTVRNGVKGQQIPEGALVCNFSQDLMDHDQVVTFFHEFGHLMHHILGGNQEYIHFSGVSTEWDFVEAPSQFFEEWAWDPKVLQGFSKIPTNLVTKMRAADEFGKGIDTRRQMFLAALSLQYYLRDPATFEPGTLFETLQNKYNVFPYVPDTHMELSFGHLHDYSAMYYTYMWSKVIAKDLLSAFQKNGLTDKKQAKRYRELILEAGGSKDADELVQDFFDILLLVF
ncbi:MAG: M3 family metallopeptidase [Myxococcaceae bacterium]